MPTMKERFTEIASTSRDYLTAVAEKAGIPECDCEDVVQDTYLSLLERLDKDEMPEKRNGKSILRCMRHESSKRFVESTI